MKKHPGLMQTPKDLGEGLVLRHAAKKDIEPLGDLQAHAFANPDTGELEIYLAGWTRDLMGGKHPIFKPHDFLVVEDTNANKLVSCTCLISQTWSMEGISFGVGRIEIVGTLPEYRRRGLVREQFKVLHQMSAARGELAQGITGIPFYYRQFGYEFAIELAEVRHSYIPQMIPELKKGSKQEFRLRRSKASDLPFVTKLYANGRTRGLVHCERDLKIMEFEHIHERDDKNGSVSWWDVLETRNGERAGMVMHRRYVYRGRHMVLAFELLPQYAWSDVAPSVMRELVRDASKLDPEGDKPLEKLGWILAPNHPFYETRPDLTTTASPPYAWYVRVPDLPAFLLNIRPLLERRLAASNYRRFTGSLKIHSYPKGFEMVWKNGRLLTVKPWRATAGDFGQSGFGDAAFPDLTFLKMLFGYRSRAELAAMFVDVLVNNEQTNGLLDALFPKRPSHVMPLH